MGEFLLHSPSWDQGPAPDLKSPRPCLLKLFQDIKLVGTIVGVSTSIAKTYRNIDSNKFDTLTNPEYQ